MCLISEDKLQKLKICIPLIQLFLKIQYEKIKNLLIVVYTGISDFLLKKIIVCHKSVL